MIDRKETGIAVCNNIAARQTVIDGSMAVQYKMLTDKSVAWAVCSNTTRRLTETKRTDFMIASF